MIIIHHGRALAGTLAFAVIQAHAIILGDTQAPASRELMSQISASSVFLSSAGGNHCSATVVGPRALLTSASCVGTTVDLVAQLGNQRFSLRCSREETKGPSIDLALCASDAPLPVEKISRLDVAHPAAKGEKLVISGYGCSSPGALDRAVLGRFSLGYAQATQIDDEKATPPWLTLQGAAACLGDAGGGVYRSDKINQFVLVGVISRSDMLRTTLAVPLALAPMANFVQQWMKQLGIDICGLSDGVQSCAPGAGMATVKPGELLALRGPKQGKVDVAVPADAQLVKAADAGETVALAFQRVCGLNLNSIPGISVEKVQQAAAVRANADGQLQIPLCPVTGIPTTPALRTTTQVVQPGDTVWSIYKSKRDQLPPQASAPAGRDEFSAYVKRFSQINKSSADKLVPDTVVMVPPIRLPAAGLPALPPATVAATAAPQAQPIFSYVNSPADDCVGPKPSDAYPYDISMLLDVLALNRTSQVPTSFAAITIADSGLIGGGNSIFSNLVLSKRSQPDFGLFLNSIQPQLQDTEARQHGSIVASVAMGGPMFSRIAALEEKPRIQLAIHRIYYTPVIQGTSGINEGVADLEKFTDLIQWAEDKQATIVNLSLRSTTRINAIKTDLDNGNSRLLYIAAAGNQGLELSTDRADDKETMWPALFGGEYGLRVITVMATDGTGKPASFSNFGKDHVDIAAPGCKVPALLWNDETGRFQEVARSGTSLSAPLVAFTAALILSESGGEFSPTQLKRRILVSADLVPADLLDYSADARRLNIPKAVALWNDVLEAGGKTLIGTAQFFSYGTLLRDDDVIMLQCRQKQDRRILTQNLFKLARWTPSQDGMDWKVYFRSDNENSLFASDTCKIPDFLTVRFQKSGYDSTNTVVWKDVKDIVMRHRNYLH